MFERETSRKAMVRTQEKAEQVGSPGLRHMASSCPGGLH